MSQIESDLKLGKIGTLEEKYAGETPEHKKMREKKYKEAFLLYDECLAELDWVLAEDAKMLKEHVAYLAKELEESDKAEDQKRIDTDLDSLITNK